MGYRLDIVRYRKFRSKFQVKLRVNGVIHRAIEDYNEDRPILLEKSHKLLDRLENWLEGFFNLHFIIIYIICRELFGL